MLTNRLRRAAIAAASVAAIAAAVMPNDASATPRPAHTVKVRSYDAHLLKHSNQARTSNHTHDYKMNQKLWKVAHAWAKHLAATGVLAHNPNLAKQVGKVCPNWTSIGENVGVVYGNSATTVFQAYMHSPEHRANILDKSYRQVGIATVKVTVNGVLQQWDVMDFGNHC